MAGSAAAAARWGSSAHPPASPARRSTIAVVRRRPVPSLRALRRIPSATPTTALATAGRRMGQSATRRRSASSMSSMAVPWPPMKTPAERRFTGSAVSNDPCKGVTCPPFETCDVNNHGVCECGGAPMENIPRHGLPREPVLRADQRRRRAGMLADLPAVRRAIVHADLERRLGGRHRGGLLLLPGLEGGGLRSQHRTGRRSQRQLQRGQRLFRVGREQQRHLCRLSVDGGSILPHASSTATSSRWAPTSTPAPDGGNHPCPLGRVLFTPFNRHRGRHLRAAVASCGKKVTEEVSERLL